MMTQPLIAIRHHGTPAVPAPTPNNMHGVNRERVGGTHYRADVGVVTEVLDRHMKGVTAPIDIDNDRFSSPITVGIDNIASIAVPQQDWVIPRVIRDVTGPGADTAGRCPPFSRAEFTHRTVHILEYVPVRASVAYNNAWFISPWAQDNALTCTQIQ